MTNVFTYECPFCKAEIEIDKNNIPETVICPICKKEIAINRNTFYSGEAFAGEL